MAEHLIEVLVDGERMISTTSFAGLRAKLPELEQSFAEADHIDEVLEKAIALVQWTPARRKRSGPRRKASLTPETLF